MTERILSQLPPTELRGGLEETIERFSANLGKVDESLSLSRYLKVLVGEEKFEQYEFDHERSSVSSFYDLLARNIKKLEQLIGLYNKAEFDPLEYLTDFKNIPGIQVISAATHHNKKAGARDWTDLIWGNTEPLDNLSFFLSNYYCFRELAEKGSTDFYGVIEATIKDIYQKAQRIHDEITGEPSFKALSGKDLKTKQLAYLEQEFARRDRVLPILAEMKLVYETLYQLVKGISGKLK